MAENEVKVDQERASQYVHPEVRNLAADLDEAELGRLGQDVWETWQHDKDSRSEWMTMHAGWLDLYYQRDRAINPPWKGSSEESLPLLAEGCTQFHARAYRAMFPGRQIVKAIPTGNADPASIERARRVGKHMSWQLLVQNRSYKRDKDKLLLSVPLHGSFFTKAYYDPIRHMNVIENVRAADLVVPYGTGPRAIETIERKTQEIWMTINRSRILKRIGYFIDEATSVKTPQASPIQRAHDKAHGEKWNAMEREPPALVLEQHRLEDLDGDGIAEPYIVTVDSESRKVLRICVRYDTDEAGNPTDDKQPVEYYTHYCYLENPDGFYGLGLGHLVGELNKATNKLVRQTVDAGTLANAGNHSGFISQQLGLTQGEEVSISLGKFKKLPGSAEDLAKGIYQFKFPGPNAALFQVLQLLMQRSDRLATVTEALTGQTESVMQPTTVLALIEQGLQVFSTVYERLNEALTLELEKIYRLNHKHLDPQEYFAVLDIDGSIKQFHAGREDYAPDLQIMPVADPKMATEQQRLQKAQAEWNFLSTNPLVINSPMHLYNSSRRFLEALDANQIDEVLPNPSQGMLPRIDDPFQENNLLMAPFPMMPMAFPDQDHAMHQQVHAELMKNPQLSSLGQALLKQHIEAHMRMESMGQTAMGMGNGDPTGREGMAGAPGHGGSAGGTQAPLSGDGMESGGLMGSNQQTEGTAGDNRLPDRRSRLL